MDVFYTSSSDTDSPVPTDTDSATATLLCAAQEERPINPCPEDASAWRAWLQQAGFSPAEIARLVFERLRPREEGTTRR